MPPPKLDYAHIMMHLLHNEPVVAAAVRLLQQHCLCNGVVVENATPMFQSHVQEHYTRFCSDAIEASLAVGFVPFRLYVGSAGERIPEVLPLGSYTWTIIPRRDDTKRGPLLRYDVRCHDCKDTIHVYAYVPPKLYYKCVSPLSTLLDAHARLLSSRACAEAAQLWNSRCNVAFETPQAVSVDDLAQKGSAIPNQMYYAENQAGMQQGKQFCMMDWLHKTRRHMQIPDACTLLVAPLGTAVRPLPAAQEPVELPQQELAFSQAVAHVTGVPLALLVSASSTNATTEQDARLHMRTRCEALNVHLVGLLRLAYELMYPNAKSEVTFVLQQPPPVQLTPEQLLPLFDARLVDDETFSRLVHESLGGDLDASEAREGRKRRFLLESKPAATKKKK